jgi:hypothetical protein
MATKINRLFSTLLALIVIACLSGVQGQFQEQHVTSSSGYSAAALSAAQDPLRYSQFYTMASGPVLSNPIGAPQQSEIVGNMPSTLYFGEQMQPVPYDLYQSNPAYTGANSLWIKGETAWTQYAVVPRGAIVSLFAISPTGGSGLLAFEDSDGQKYSHNYFFYPNSLFTFHADTIGRHILSFTINGQASNQVVIDVTGTYAQPSNYLSPTNYYPGYYPWDYYPWGYYVPSTSPGENNKGENPGEDHKDGNKQGRDHNDGSWPDLNNASPRYPGHYEPSTSPEQNNTGKKPGGTSGWNHHGGKPGGDQVSTEETNQQPVTQLAVVARDQVSTEEINQQTTSQPVVQHPVLDNASPD